MYGAEAGYSTMSASIDDGWLFPSLEDSTADPILTARDLTLPSFHQQAVR